jgi:hypothetical protein
MRHWCCKRSLLALLIISISQYRNQLALTQGVSAITQGIQAATIADFAKLQAEAKASCIVSITPLSTNC